MTMGKFGNWFPQWLACAKSGAAIALLLAVAGCALSDLPASSSTSPTIYADTLFTGGMVYTGNRGQSGFVADIAIRGDRIVFVGDADAASVGARERIDATGLVVAPGFIDPHTHADGDLLSSEPQRRLNANYLTQGVTTVLVGNDGGGSADLKGQIEQIVERGIGSNVAFLVGHGAVREMVVGLADRAPTATEMTRMKELVANAMCEGALGFSTGLFYTPQSFANTDEVVSLASEAGKRGGIYDTHLRDESSYSIGLLAAVAEAIEIGERASLPTNISHIKALGADVWGDSDQVIALIEAARRQGHQVTADQYPWLASGTRISSALLPRWALNGGLEGARRRFADQATLDRIKAEMTENLRRRGGADSLLITRMVDGAPSYEGKRLGEIAAARNVDAIDMALAILREGDAQIASFNMREDDVLAFMARPWVMTSSDGSNGHPRKYGSFPHKFAKYVRESHDLNMDEFLYRSAGLAALTFGIPQRGFLREGYFADMVVFDPARFRARADYAHPERLSEGVVHLLVNGQFAIRDNELSKRLSGRAVRKEQNHGAELCPVSNNSKGE